MFEKIKENLIDRRIQKALKRDLSPSVKETDHARVAFLSEVRAQFPFTTAIKSPYRYMSMSLAALALILILNGGAIAYADAINVPLNHPLYSFKRVAEEVRVLSATSNKKPELEAQIVERRLKELESIQVVTASSSASTTVKTKAHIKAEAKLQKNLKKHIESVEKEIEKAPSLNKVEKRAAICKKIVPVDALLFNSNESEKNIKAKILKICDTKTDTQTKDKKDAVMQSGQVIQSIKDLSKDLQKDPQQDLPNESQKDSQKDSKNPTEIMKPEIKESSKSSNSIDLKKATSTESKSSKKSGRFEVKNNVKLDVGQD